MAIKVAINGFGRIGRVLTRLISNDNDMELVAINDIIDIDSIGYLFRKDTIHGSFLDCEVLNRDYIRIKNQNIKISSTKNHSDIDFSGADIVYECSGKFLTTKEAMDYRDSQVILSAPAVDDTPTFVYGVNHTEYNGQKVVSNASCTTNAIAPILQSIDSINPIIKGQMTTIHSYTNDQNLIDGYHPKELRRSRAAAQNIIPTTTGAAKAIHLVLPNLKGKINGQSVRVPVANVSMVDLVLLVQNNTTVEDINRILFDSSNNRFKNILGIDNDFGVSSDFVSNPLSSIVATDLTQVVDGNLIKIMAWYDNEWGYSNRLKDMGKYLYQNRRISK